MSTTYRVKTSGSTICRNYQRIKACRSREELVEEIVPTFHYLLFSVCSISLVASAMLSINAKLSSNVLAVREREREAVNMQGTVFKLARLKKVPSYHQKIVSPPMPLRGTTPETIET